MQLTTVNPNRQSLQSCFFCFISSGIGIGHSTQDHAKTWTWETTVYIKSTFIGPNRATCEGYQKRFMAECHHKELLIMHGRYQTKMPGFQETYMVYRKLCLILNDLM